VTAIPTPPQPVVKKVDVAPPEGVYEEAIEVESKRTLTIQITAKKRACLSF
jgi:hypothetical protein